MSGEEYARLVDAADDEQLASLEDALWELDKRVELALIECARLGLADDHLRVLCFLGGVETSRIKQ